LADENRKFFGEKVKLWKFSTESEIFSEIGGIWNRGEMHHCLRGMDAPGAASVLILLYMYDIVCVVLYIDFTSLPPALSSVTIRSL